MATGFLQSVNSGTTAAGFLDDDSRARTQRRNSEQFFIVAAMIAAWAALAFVFSLPDRDEPLTVGGLDLLGLGKVVSRVGGLVFLVAVNLMMVHQMKIRVVVFYMAGFIAFFCWSVATITWSALPAVSAGQLMSLAVLMMLGATIARVVESDHGVRMLLFHLSLLLVIRATVMVLCYVAMGADAVSREHNSFFHSTDAAETASIGIVVLATSMMGFPTLLTRTLFYPGMIVFGMLFMIAQNRLTMIITPPVFLLIFLMNGNRQGLVKLGFLCSLIVPAVMLADPGLEVFSKLVGSTEQYAMRSGDDNTLTTFSGRTELWEAIWQEYLKSPIMGLGYFVTSTTGELDVWFVPRNYTAHNQLFQVLATTGMIGLVLFFSGLAIPFRLVMSKLFLKDSRGRAARSVAVIFIWLALWGLLNSSFSGPLGTSSIAFWIIVGLAVGRLRRPPEGLVPGQIAA